MGPEPGQTDVGAPDRARILRAAGGVAGMTLLSRIAGCLRDVVVARLLGTGLEADAWRVAFQLPNTLRRVVGEGNVSAAFVPVFVGLSAKRGTDVWALAGGFYTCVLLVVAVLTALGVLAAPWLVELFAPGFSGVPGKLALTAELTRKVFPYLLFISLAAVLMAILNAKERFLASAFAPVLFNLSIIACATLLADRWMEPVQAVVLGAVVGGFAQWCFQLPFARRLGMPLRPRMEFADPGLRRIGRLMVPGLFGVGVVQINILVGTVLASYLPEGSVSSLYFAARLNELTLGVFAISVATVVLPTMSRQAAEGSLEELRKTLNFSLRQISLIILPAAVGLFLLRQDIVAMLFERGQFGAESTTLTAAALAGYCVGLLGFAAVRVVTPCFYALQDTRTPVMVGGIAMVINVLAALALMGPLRNAGIALANSLAGYVSAALLIVLLRRRLGWLGGRLLLTSWLRHAAAATAMGLAITGLTLRWQPVDPGFLAQLSFLSAVILVAVLTYTAGLAALAAPELIELRALVSGGMPAESDAESGGT